MDKKEIREINGDTFGNAKSNVISWYNSANQFHAGALILAQHINSFDGGMRVFLVNAAISLELLYKAIIVAQGNEAPISHILISLAHDADVSCPDKQKATLELMSEIFKWSGRYPVPNKEESWNNYHDNVLERHIIRGRSKDGAFIVANREIFPSIEKYIELWERAKQKWDEIQSNKHLLR
jgi:hypothetical protein